MAIDSKFLVLTKEALKNKVSNLDSSWTTILINGDLAYSTKGADAGLANNLCVNADLLKAIITGNLRYEAKAEDNFLLDGDYYTLKNINGVNVPYALKQVLDFIALLKKPYTVEFRDGSTVLSTLTVYWNGKVTKPTDPTKSGYNFTGWTPSWNFNTDTLNNQNQLDNSGKLIFTALWEASNPYYISFSLGNEVTNEDFKDIMGDLDTTGYLLELNSPSQTSSITKYLSSSTASFNITNLTIGRNTYTIANLPSLYYITVNGTRMYSNSLPITVNSGNIDIVFHLNVGYTLTYYRNYPTGSTSTSLSYDASGNTSVKTLSNVGFSTPSGYNFVRWNTNANGTGTNYNPGSTINVNADTNLYAIWEESTPSVEVTCYEYRILSFEADNISATDTTIPYSITIQYKRHYSDGTIDDWENYNNYPSEALTVTGTSVEPNTDSTPKEYTLTAEYLANYEGDSCNDTILTATATAILAAAGQDTEVAYSQYFLYDVNDISDSLVDAGNRILITYKSKRLDYNQAGELLATHHGLDGSGNILTSMLMNTSQYYYIIGHYTSDDSDHLLDDYVERDEYDRTNYIFKPYFVINYPCLDSSGNDWDSTPNMTYNYKLRVLGPNSTEVDFYYGEDTTGELIEAGNWKHFSGSMSAPDCSTTPPTPPTPVSATITYKPHGGSGEDVVDSVTVGLATTTITNPFNRDDADVTQAWWQITGKSDFSATASYTFDSWNTESDGSGTSYGENDSITPVGDTILYAIWNSEVTIEGEGEVSDTINGSPDVICTYNAGSENEENIYFEYQNSSILTLLENDVTLQATNIVNSIKQTLLETGKGYNIETEIGQPELSGYIYIYWWGKDSSGDYYHSYGTTYTSLGKWEGTCPPTLTGGLYRLVAVITVRTDGTYEYSLYMNDNYAEVTATCPYSIKFNV